jgi:hypothetical protein
MLNVLVQIANKMGLQKKCDTASKVFTPPGSCSVTVVEVNITLKIFCRIFIPAIQICCVMIQLFNDASSDA